MMRLYFELKNREASYAVVTENVTDKKDIGTNLPKKINTIRADSKRGRNKSFL